MECDRHCRMPEYTPGRYPHSIGLLQTFGERTGEVSSVTGGVCSQYPVWWRAWRSEANRYLEFGSSLQATRDEYFARQV